MREGGREECEGGREECEGGREGGRNVREDPLTHVIFTAFFSLSRCGYLMMTAFYSQLVWTDLCWCSGSAIRRGGGSRQRRMWVMLRRCLSQELIWRKRYGWHLALSAR